MSFEAGGASCFAVDLDWMKSEAFGVFISASALAFLLMKYWVALVFGALLCACDGEGAAHKRVANKVIYFTQYISVLISIFGCWVLVARLSLMVMMILWMIL